MPTFWTEVRGEQGIQALCTRQTSLYQTLFSFSQDNRTGYSAKYQHLDKSVYVHRGYAEHTSSSTVYQTLHSFSQDNRGEQDTGLNTNILDKSFV